jgi:hypothetical protein
MKTLRLFAGLFESARALGPCRVREEETRGAGTEELHRSLPNAEAMIEVRGALVKLEVFIERVCSVFSN